MLLFLFKLSRQYLAYSSEVERAISAKDLLKAVLDTIIPNHILPQCLKGDDSQSQRQNSSDMVQKETTLALLADHLYSTIYF